MMRPNVPNWQIFFSRRQTSTRELATQGNIQWLATFTCAFGKRFYPKWLTLKELFFLLIVCNVIDFSLLTYFKCHCGLIKISLMLREVRKRKRQKQTLIFSEITAARQKVPDKHTKLTDICSRQTSTQELATQGTVTIVKNYRTMRQ